MLKFMSEEEKERALSAAEEILHYDEKSQLHTLVARHLERVRKWNKKHKSIEGRNASASDYIYHTFHMTGEYILLGGVVADGTLERASRILDALIKALESSGCKINPDLSFEVFGIDMDINIHEKQKKVDHVLTKDEIQLLAWHESETNAWKPFVKKFDHCFNGELYISVRMNKCYTDSSNRKIEKDLGSLLIDIFTKAARLRHEQELRNVEEEKLREERRLLEVEQEKQRLEAERIAKELEEVKQLESGASAWDMACKIRAFIHEVELKDINNEKTDWIQWAKNKADWLDPTIGREDEILGKRLEEDKLILDSPMNDNCT